MSVPTVLSVFDLKKRLCAEGGYVFNPAQVAVRNNSADGVLCTRVFQKGESMSISDTTRIYGKNYVQLHDGFIEESDEWRDVMEEAYQGARVFAACVASNNIDVSDLYETLGSFKQGPEMAVHSFFPGGEIISLSYMILRKSYRSNTDASGKNTVRKNGKRQKKSPVP